MPSALSVTVRTPSRRLIVRVLGLLWLACAAFDASGQADASNHGGERPEALHALGCLQEQTGQEAAARESFMQAAAAGWPAARFNLGVLLLEGRGGEVERSRGQDLIEAAWNDQAAPHAGAWLLEDALARDDTGRARALTGALEPLAHPRSDMVLARVYFAQGRHERALHVTRRAARAGQPQAARLLALLPGSPDGLPRDAAESAAWRLIAQTVLERPHAWDSMLGAAVKTLLQTDDWIAGGRALRPSALACDGVLHLAGLEAEAADARAAAPPSPLAPGGSPAVEAGGARAADVPPTSARRRPLPPKKKPVARAPRASAVASATGSGSLPACACVQAPASSAGADRPRAR